MSTGSLPITSRALADTLDEQPPAHTAPATPADVAARIYRHGGVIRIQTLLAARQREQSAQVTILENAYTVFRAAIHDTWRTSTADTDAAVVDTPAGLLPVSTTALRVLRRHGTVLGRQLRESQDAIARIDREISQLRAALPAGDDARSALRVVR